MPQYQDTFLNLTTFKGAQSQYFGHVQNYLSIEGNLKIVVY